MGAIKEIKEYRVVHGDKGINISVVLRKETSEDGVSHEVKTNLTKSFETLGVTFPDIHIRVIDKIERDPHMMGKIKLVQSNRERVGERVRP